MSDKIDLTNPAVRDAYNTAFNETLRKVQAVASLPGVNPASAVAFVAAGMDVDDVRRLAPEEVMRRALRPH